MPPDRILTAADLAGYLEPLDMRPKPAAESHVRDAYRSAAAVLAAIRDPDGLRPVEGESGKARQALAGDLTSTSAERALGGSTMLRFDIRREALRKLGSREAMLSALEWNPEERRGPVQEVFESYLKGTAKPLGDQSAAQLDETLQALIWLDGLGLAGVPQADEARQALARANFRQSFERLAGAQFRGRLTELDILRNFVGILPPESLRGKADLGTRAVSRLLGLKPKQALSLYGPGGIGKSALVMRFFLEHIDRPEGERVPFAYLDFDSPFLNISDVSTIAGEMLRQIAIQFPALEIPAPPDCPDRAADALADLLGNVAAHANQPYLVVLDTFEEVQYGGESRAYPLWEMLGKLQTQWPFLRVVVSGRAPVRTLKLSGKEPENLALEGLDHDAALGILRSAGVSDPATAETLIKQVGRVPLSLLLAAALVQKEGLEQKGIRNLETTSYFFLQLSDEVIQGQLYDRILGHIHDPQVVKLAHPGLVLRRVSAELILEVLKKPCGLSLTTLDEARKLYEALARETALVTEERGGWLHHRQDLRRTMLRLMVEKQPRCAEEIHRGAIEYYSTHDTPGGLAERMYHRLMLGDVPYGEEKTLARPEVRQSLSPTVSEMPTQAQIFLAGVGYDVPEEVLRQASQSQYDDHFAAKIEEMLPQGPEAYEAAGQLLQKGSYRGRNSPLCLSAARLLFLKGQLAQAVEVLDDGLKSALGAGDTNRVLDLLCLKSWTLEEMKSTGDLGRTLEYLQRYADRLGRNLARLQCLAQRARFQAAGTDQPASDVASSIALLLRELPERDFVAMAPVLAGVFTIVTPFDPAPLRRLAPVIAWARIEPGYLAPLLPLLQDVGSSAGKWSAESLSSGLWRLAHEDDEKVLRGTAGAVDAVLRSWPQRLIYLYRPEPAPAAA